METEVHKAARELRTAQVSHTCRDCGHMIHPGQKYLRRTYKVDGRFIIEKTHEPRPVDLDECTWPRRKSAEG